MLKKRWCGVGMMMVSLTTVGAPIVQHGSYGPHPEETWTWYHAVTGKQNPVVMIVHGGGWRYGDKSSPKVVDGKVAFFNRQGLDVMSINYPMLPAVPVVDQIQSVNRAVTYLKNNANHWGGDGSRVVLLGHSAGAHLVTMVSLKRSDILGSISLDSAVYDVKSVMSTPHLPLYDAAFKGVDIQSVSPLANINPGATPMVGVCSTQRRTACWETQKFAEALGVMTVIPEAKSHSDINDQLGKDLVYTQKIWAVIKRWLAM